MNQQGAALQQGQAAGNEDPNAQAQAQAPGVDDSTAQAGSTEEDQFNDVELVALEMGWNPDHDGEEYKDAKTFILDGQKIQKNINTQNQQLKETVSDFRHALESLREHQTKLAQVETGRIETQIDDLNKQLNAAIEDGDVPKSRELLERIDKLRGATAQAPKQPAGQGQQQPAGQQSVGNLQQLTPAQQTFLDENKWYGTDPELTAYADAQSERFRGLPDNRYFSELTRAVKTMFPDRFPKRTRTPSVEGGGGRRPQGGGGGGKKFTINDLSDDQKRLAVFYEKQKIMTTDKYIDELVRIGELK